MIESKNVLVPSAFAPDGKRLAFVELSPEGVFGIWTGPVESGGTGLKAGKPEPFLQAPFDASSPRFSPDERWLAYSSGESGTREVYVKAFPDRGGKWQISNGGGVHPFFAHGGASCSSGLSDSRGRIGASALMTIGGGKFCSGEAAMAVTCPAAT